MPDYDVLGYVVAHALLLPSRTAAVMLACAIGAGDAQILTTVAAQQETRMSKREIRKRLAEYADELARESGDPAAVRDAWIDVGASDAGWTRRGAKRTKSGRRVGARAR